MTVVDNTFRIMKTWAMTQTLYNTTTQNASTPVVSLYCICYLVCKMQTPPFILSECVLIWHSQL